jgi:hypothetical protein
VVIGMSDAQKIIDEARATLARTSRDNLDKSRLRYREMVGGVELLNTERPVETAGERWRKEMGELADERDHAKSLLAFAREIHAATVRQRQDMSESMKAVNQFAATIVEQVHGLSADVDAIKAKLKIAEQRFEDLKRSFDGSGRAADSRADSSSVVDLKPSRRA